MYEEDKHVCLKVSYEEVVCEVTSLFHNQLFKVSVNLTKEKLEVR